MFLHRVLLAFILTFSLNAPASSAAFSSIKQLTIAHQTFTLDNGLRVVIHEDHSSPVVSIVVIYGVGSKDERVGRRGFAHLFEHLMFNGSENFNDDYFKAMEKLGAYNINGTTSRDRTIYFQTVPTQALDTVLWLESDRMRNLLGVVNQARLDEQRKVVLNEKRQKESQPYGRLMSEAIKLSYPAGHPYSWATIGEDDDLNQASLKDVKDWFETYYGAANAVIVLAGDISAEDAQKRVKHYFSGVRPGAPITKISTFVAPRETSTLQTLYDQVPQARLTRFWNIPAMGDKDLAALELFSDIIGVGPASPLHQRLVEKEKLASSVSASIWPGLLGSSFIIDVHLRPGVSMDEVERVLKDECDRLFNRAVSAKQLRLVKVSYLTSFLNGLETTLSKAQMFAYNTLYFGDPAYYKTDLRRLENLQPKDLLRASQRYLRQGDHTVHTFPFEAKNPAPETVDRSRLPLPTDTRLSSFPSPETFKLTNGLTVHLVTQSKLPLVKGTLIVPGGTAHDSQETRGAAHMLNLLMNYGTAHATSAEKQQALALLGAQVGVSVGIEHSQINFNTLKETLPQTLTWVKDVATRPRFRPDMFELAQKNALDQLSRELTDPRASANRVFRGLFFETSHPFAAPPSGLGTQDSLKRINLDRLKALHPRIFQPQKAHLIVVGDVKKHGLQTLLEKSLGHWTVKSAETFDLVDLDQAQIATPQEAIYVIDKPGATSSYIQLGMQAAPRSSTQDVLTLALHASLGGMFTSRLNMNLREEKGWSYGMRTGVHHFRGPRAFVVAGSVQTDKTAASLAEIYRELREVASTRPISPEELEKVKTYVLHQMPSWTETQGAILGRLEDIVRERLPSDYFISLPQKVLDIGLEDLRRYTQQWVKTKGNVCIVVGDKSKIMSDLKALNLGPVREINPETLEPMPPKD